VQLPFLTGAKIHQRPFLKPNEVEELRLLTDFEEIRHEVKTFEEYNDRLNEDYTMVQVANRNYKSKATKPKPAKDGFEAIFGGKDVFFDGLHQYGGRPMVAGNEKLKMAMYREFNGCIDPGIRIIKTSNYGYGQQAYICLRSILSFPVLNQLAHPL